MTTLTVDINDKKTEKVPPAEDEVLYKRLQKSAIEIKQFRKGKIDLESALDFLNEL